ncbi:MAG: LysR substrate-binding domain-containing protein [Hyphomicrobiaceae bacterium]
MPSIRQLEYLLALNETRHFRRAAARVGVSQPTLSAQLSALEERLGVQLVERSRSSVLVTSVGEQVVEIARRVIRNVQEIEDVAAGHKDELAGTIRLGLPHTIGPYLLPRVIPRIHKSYPDLKLYVREEVPHELPRSLEYGIHDLIITPIPVRAEGLAMLPLFREPLYLAVASDSDLASCEHIERKDLKGRSIIALETGHQLREQVDAICNEFGAVLLTDFEGTSLDTIRQMVGMGMGLSFLPGLYVHSNLSKDSAVRTVELKGRALYRTIGLMWRQTSARKDEFVRLAEHIRETVKRSFPKFQLLGQ